MNHCNHNIDKNKYHHEKGLIIHTTKINNLDTSHKKYVQLLGSAAHTYGNALAFMQRYILNLFPKDLFRTVHVNSRLAHMQMKQVNTNFIKKPKPMIIFRPRIADLSEDRFLKGTLWTDRQTDLYNTWGVTNLQEFFTDPENDIVMKYQLNRHVIYIDVICVFATLMQQINYVQYLQNAVRINHPFFIQTYFENFLPQELLDIISHISGIPLYDEDKSTKTFLDYMNGHSIYPITYKLQGSTDTKEFYRYYPVNIDATISDIGWNDGEKVGHVMDSYQVTFSVRIEFNATGFYYLFSDKIFDMELPRHNPENSNVIPVYTDVYSREDLNLNVGWNLYNSASCRFGDGEDKINIAEMFNQSIKSTIKYCRRNGLPLENYLDIKVRRNGVFMIPCKDYKFNADTCEVSILHAVPQQTYHFMVCVNTALINELIKEIHHLE